MAQDRFNLNRHFIFWFLEDLIEVYEKSGTITRIISIDFNNPLKSVVAIECPLMGKEISNDQFIQR